LGSTGNKFGLALDGRSIAPLAVDGSGTLIGLLFRQQLQQRLALGVVFRFSELLAEILEIVAVQELVHPRLPGPWTKPILSPDVVRVDHNVVFPTLQIGNQEAQVRASASTPHLLYAQGSTRHSPPPAAGSHLDL
jgi:hypothetical protein